MKVCGWQKEEKGKLWHSVQVPEEMADTGSRQEGQAQTMKERDDKIPQAGFNIQKQKDLTVVFSPQREF